MAGTSPGDPDPCCVPRHAGHRNLCFLGTHTVSWLASYIASKCIDALGKTADRYVRPCSMAPELRAGPSHRSGELEGHTHAQEIGGQTIGGDLS